MSGAVIFWLLGSFFAAVGGGALARVPDDRLLSAVLLATGLTFLTLVALGDVG